MKTELNDLEHLKKTDSFFVPAGYMEGMTSRIMGRLPEHPHTKARKVTWFDRCKPWLYMAAAFVGIILIFKTFNALFPSNPNNKSAKESLVVNNDTSGSVYTTTTEENKEYLDYIEGQYSDKILSEDLADAE